MTEHRRDNDSPGSDRAHRKWLTGLSNGLLNIQTYQQEIQEGRPTLTGLVVKCDPDDEAGVLVVLKGYLGQVEMVAFHRADTVSEAISSTGNRLRNGSLKWKEDQYAADR